ncbi:hypothetical protein [Anaerotignum faecicola]
MTISTSCAKSLPCMRSSPNVNSRAFSLIFANVKSNSPERISASKSEKLTSASISSVAASTASVSSPSVSPSMQIASAVSSANVVLGRRESSKIRSNPHFFILPPPIPSP